MDLEVRNLESTHPPAPRHSSTRVPPPPPLSPPSDPAASLKSAPSLPCSHSALLLSRFLSPSSSWAPACRRQVCYSSVRFVWEGGWRARMEMGKKKKRRCPNLGTNLGTFSRCRLWVHIHRSSKLNFPVVYTLVIYIQTNFAIYLWINFLLKI